MSNESFSPADQEGKGGESQGATFGDQQQNDNSATGNDGALNLTTEQVNDIVRRDEHAQQHIKTLEAETKQYREELENLRKKADAALTADEILEKLANKDNNSGDIDVDAIVSRVTETVNQTQQKAEAKRVQDENFRKVSEAVKGKFGEKADVEMTKIAVANGMSFEEIYQMAHTNPTLVMKLCNVIDGTPTSPSRGTVNSLAYKEEAASEIVNVMNLRTTSALVSDFNRRMDEYTKNQ